MKKDPMELQLDAPGSCEKVFREGDRTLLTVSARWPRLAETGPAPRRVTRYYDALAQRWLDRWAGPLLDRAKVRLPEGAPSWQAALDFTVTLFEGGTLSLYLDAVEDAGARRPRRVRQGDAWIFPEGAPVTLRELLPRRRWWKGPVLEEVRRQIGERIAAGESVFYEDWPALASKRFSPRRFYLTPAGPVVFYPVEALAPAMEGFPAFSLAALMGET